MPRKTIQDLLATQRTAVEAFRVAGKTDQEIIDLLDPIIVPFPYVGDTQVAATSTSISAAMFAIFANIPVDWVEKCKFLGFQLDEVRKAAVEKYGYIACLQMAVFGAIRGPGGARRDDAKNVMITLKKRNQGVLADIQVPLNTFATQNPLGDQIPINGKFNSATKVIPLAAVVQAFVLEAQALICSLNVNIPKKFPSIPISGNFQNLGAIALPLGPRMLALVLIYLCKMTKTLHEFSVRQAASTSVAVAAAVKSLQDQLLASMNVWKAQISAKSIDYGDDEIKKIIYEKIIHEESLLKANALFTDIKIRAATPSAVRKIIEVVFAGSTFDAVMATALPTTAASTTTDDVWTDADWRVKMVEMFEIGVGNLYMNV